MGWTSICGNDLGLCRQSDVVLVGGVGRGDRDRIARQIPPREWEHVVAQPNFVPKGIVQMLVGGVRFVGKPDRMAGDTFDDAIFSRRDDFLGVGLFHVDSTVTAAGAGAP